MNVFTKAILGVIFMSICGVPFALRLGQSSQSRAVRNGSLPEVSPDGKHVIFSSNRNGSDDLFVVRVDGSNVRQLTSTTEGENFAGWGADGRNIFFSVSNNDSSSIYSIDLAGKNQRLVATVPGRSPIVSPNGKLVLYTAGSWTAVKLMLSSLDGQGSRQINDGNSIAWNVHWSPDGRKFAFTGRSDPKSELAVFVANADGSDVHQVSHVPSAEGGGQWPVWSPAGRKLAIQVNSRTQKNSAHLWVVDLTSGKSEKLAAHDQAYLDETPCWFPDGQRIAFQSNRTGRMEVWIMNADGTQPIQLTR